MSHTDATRILLVEDSAADAAWMRHTLSATNYGPFTLAHAQRLDAALGQLEGKQFDVVLLDLGLPDSQGMETLEKMRRKVRELPVVVLTGLDDEALAVRALQEGAQDYLVKGEAVGSIMARAIRYAIERKRAQDAIQSREAELAHMSRVSAMGQMASGLAHELNQPLSAILNYASVCLDQVQSGNPGVPVVVNALQELMDETRRAGVIISRLRSFLRKKQPQRTPVDINALVEESLNILDFELRHQGMRPRLKLAAGLTKVLADPVQIEQVLVNLIYNALEAMDSQTDLERKELSLHTRMARRADTVEVCVADNGPGVPPEIMERLFEPFFTTKQQGLGMGLNISRSIVEGHGGQLNASANAGGGMRFCFTLPVATEG
jgi:C4-dicarboxylate-specific signal transduction histidine kinase